jgi:hypothetical protein
VLDRPAVPILAVAVAERRELAGQTLRRIASERTALV